MEEGEDLWTWTLRRESGVESFVIQGPIPHVTGLDSKFGLSFNLVLCPFTHNCSVTTTRSGIVSRFRIVDITAELQQVAVYIPDLRHFISIFYPAVCTGRVLLFSHWDSPLTLDTSYLIVSIEHLHSGKLHFPRIGICQTHRYNFIRSNVLRDLLERVFFLSRFAQVKHS